MLMQDLRFAFRQFRKNPGFGLTAMLMLALGIGASVAIFAFVDAALIKPLPYADPNRLVAPTETVATFGRANLSYQDYLDWKRMNKVFASLDVYTGTGYLLRTATGTEPVPAARVSDGFFRTLGVVPILGRDFYAGEDSPSAPKAVILSYSVWQRRFGGRKDVIGETVSLSGVAMTVIGVLPASFQFAPRGNAEIWAALHPDDPCNSRRSCHGLNGIARLRDGVTVEAAQADATTIAKQLEKQYPDSNRGQGASVITLSECDYIVGNVRPIFLALLGGAGLLLLIGVRECFEPAVGAFGEPEAGDRGAWRFGGIAGAVGDAVVHRGSGASGGGKLAWPGFGFWSHSEVLLRLIPSDLGDGGVRFLRGWD